MSDAAPLKPRRKPAAPPDPEKRAARLAERARLRPDRVEFCCELMRELTYRWDTTDYLAQAWGIPLHEMKKIAADAARIVRAEITDPDRVLSKVSFALERVIDDAIACGDRHAVIKAAQVWAIVSGASAPQRVQVQQTDLSNLSLEQLQARRDEILGRLSKDAPVKLPPARVENGTVVETPDKDAAR